MSVIQNPRTANQQRADASLPTPDTGGMGRGGCHGATMCVRLCSPSYRRLDLNTFPHPSLQEAAEDF